jgi:hypothetical protein
MMAPVRPPDGRGRGKREGRRRRGYPAVFCVLLISIGLLAACSRAATVVTTTTRPAPGTVADPVAPSIYSVKTGRFIETVEVGDGALLVSPPSKKAVPGISAVQADSLFDADYSFKGIYAFDVVGLGSATVTDTQDQTTSYDTRQTSGSSSATAAATTTTAKTTTTTKPPPTTTTAPPPTTTTAPPPPTTTAPPPPTTTTALPPSTTTTAPAPTTTTVPPPTTPVYEKRLAWVGIAVGQKPSCAGGTPSIMAVVIDAYTGLDVTQIEVTGGCNGAATPAFSKPFELESVPWSIVGPGSTAITAIIPRCGLYVGWTQVTVKTVLAIQVQAAVPYDPSCAQTGVRSRVIDLVVPLGSSENTVPHAPGGLIDQLDVLP